jgi:hypothetical protein
MLWIEEVKQLFFFVLAERGADTHVAHDGAGYARRESIGCIVATRTVLLKDALAIILLRGGMRRAGFSR